MVNRMFHPRQGHVASADKSVLESRMGLRPLWSPEWKAKRSLTLKTGPPLSKPETREDALRSATRPSAGTTPGTTLRNHTIGPGPEEKLGN